MSIPLYAQTTPWTGRGLDPAIWGPRTVRDYHSDDPKFGIRIRDDFTTERTNTTDASAEDHWWIQDAAAGGTSESFVSTASGDGVATLSADTGTAHFGIEAWYAKSAAGVATLPTGKHRTAASARGRLNFQTRVDLDDADVFFIGLTEGGAEFLSATSTLPDGVDYAGFFYDGSTLKFETRNDNNGGTDVEGSYTITDSIQTGWNNLAFAIDKDGQVHISFNGQYYGPAKNSLSATATPVEFLLPRYCITRGSGSSTAVDLPIDSIDIFVEGITG